MYTVTYANAKPGKIKHALVDNIVSFSKYG